MNKITKNHLHLLSVLYSHLSRSQRDISTQGQALAFDRNGQTHISQIKIKLYIVSWSVVLDIVPIYAVKTFNMAPMDLPLDLLSKNEVKLALYQRFILFIYFIFCSLEKRLCISVELSWSNKGR